MVAPIFRHVLPGPEVSLMCKGRALFRTSTAILVGCALVQSYQKLPGGQSAKREQGAARTLQSLHRVKTVPMRSFVCRVVIARRRILTSSQTDNPHLTRKVRRRVLLNLCLEVRGSCQNISVASEAGEKSPASPAQPVARNGASWPTDDTPAVHSAALQLPHAALSAHLPIGFAVEV